MGFGTNPMAPLMETRKDSTGAKASKESPSRKTNIEHENPVFLRVEPTNHKCDIHRKEKVWNPPVVHEKASGDYTAS